jgi:hypothetical protein
MRSSPAIKSPKDFGRSEDTNGDVGDGRLIGSGVDNGFRADTMMLVSSGVEETFLPDLKIEGINKFEGAEV